MRALNAIVLLAGLVVSASPAIASDQNSPSPGVSLSITPPNGKTEQLMTHESGLATVTVDGREYGFRPTMHDDLGTQMTITIFDMGSKTESVREIGMVDVKGGAAPVASKTTPVFKVRAMKAPGGTT